MERSELIALIRSAFSDVPYPGDDNITRSASRCLEWECRFLSDYFRGTTQSGHTTEALRERESAFSFFTADALLYWLPTFMIGALAQPEVADVIWDRLISFCSLRIFDPEWSDLQGPDVVVLTAKQKEAMTLFIKSQYDGEDDGVKAALYALR